MYNTQEYKTRGSTITKKTPVLFYHAIFLSVCMIERDCENSNCRALNTGSASVCDIADFQAANFPLNLSPCSNLRSITKLLTILLELPADDQLLQLGLKMKWFDGVTLKKLG